MSTARQEEPGSVGDDLADVLHRAAEAASGGGLRAVTLSSSRAERRMAGLRAAGSGLAGLGWTVASGLAPSGAGAPWGGFDALLAELVPASPVTLVGSGCNRWQAVEVLATAVEGVARRRPLALVLADRQVVDRESVAALPALSWRLAASSVLLVTAGRPGVTPTVQADIVDLDGGRSRAADVGPDRDRLRAAALIAALGPLTLHQLTVGAEALDADLDATERAIDGMVAEGILTVGVDPAGETVITAPPELVEVTAHGDEQRRAAEALAADAERRWMSGDRSRPVGMAPAVARVGARGAVAAEILDAGASALGEEGPDRATAWYRSALEAGHPDATFDARVRSALARRLIASRRWQEAADLSGDALAAGQASGAVREELFLSLIWALSHLGQHRQAAATVTGLRRGDADLTADLHRAPPLVLAERFDDAIAVVIPCLAGSPAIRVMAMVGLTVAAAMSKPRHEYEQLIADVPEVAAAATLPLADRIRETAGWGDMYGTQAEIPGVPLPPAELAAAVSAARRALMEGRVAEVADAVARAEQHFSEDTTYRSTLGRSYGIIADVARGDLAAAGHRLGALADDQPFRHVAALARTAYLVSAGRPDEARGHVTDAIRHAGEVGYQAALPHLWSALVDLELSAGRPVAAADALAQLREATRPFETAAGRWRVLYAASRVQADPEAAVAAVELAAALASPVRLALASLTAGQLGVDPAQTLTVAHRELRALDMAPGVRAAAAELRRRGLPVPRRRTPRPDVDRPLLERVVAGDTNRQIAAALHLNVKTVERRLHRLFLASGAASRAELCEWFLAGGAPGRTDGS